MLDLWIIEELSKQPPEEQLVLELPLYDYTKEPERPVADVEPRGVITFDL